MRKQNERTKDHWFELVKKYNKTNKTIKKWCKENNLALSTFSRYRKRFNNENKASKGEPNTSVEWEEIIVEPEKESKKSEKISTNNIVKISLGKISIDINDNIDKENFKNILSVVMDVC